MSIQLQFFENKNFNSVSRRPPLHKQEKPPVGYPRCNVDAAVLEQSAAMGAGFAIRDHDGAVNCCGSLKTRVLFTPAMVEAVNWSFRKL